MLKVTLLPLLILAAALEVGDERIERDGIVVVAARVVVGEVEIGAELEAAVAAVRVVGGGIGDE